MRVGSSPTDGTKTNVKPNKERTMKEYVFYFRKKLNKEVNIKYLDEDFVNDFMYENKLFGEDIFDELLKELHKYQK